jgi:gliding motility-associated-like protein
VNGCEASDEMEINIVSFQTEIEGDFTACVGDTVELAIVNPNISFTYNWSPEDLIISGQNTSQVEVVVNETTTFTVVSNTPEGCTATDDVTVDVSELQSMSINATGSPTTIVVGQTVQLNVEPSGYTYSWGPVEFVSDSNIPNPTATPTESTTYYVTISDGECSATDSLRITVLDFVCGPPSIYVPNAFTPNSDSRNEKLFVRALNVTKINFVIYDRWGEKVFETNSQYIGWDGYFRDKLVDPAVFVYYLEATCEGGATYFEKGNITVIR